MIVRFNFYRDWPFVEIASSLAIKMGVSSVCLPTRNGLDDRRSCLGNLSERVAPDEPAHCEAEKPGGKVKTICPTKGGPKSVK
jgi:hypothetical protein